MIPDQISKSVSDDTLVYKHHNVFTHMICVMIRVIIGLALMSNQLSKKTRNTIVIILIIIMIIFAFKYAIELHRGRTYWKNYPRYIISASVVSYLALNGSEQFAGLLLIVDALMGMDSRHSAAVATKICNS